MNRNSNTSEKQAVDEIISLEESIALQEAIVTKVSGYLDDTYNAPDALWIGTWLSDEIELLETLKGLQNG